MADGSAPDRSRHRNWHDGLLSPINNGTSDGVLDTARDGVQWPVNYCLMATRNLMAGPDRNRPRFLIINGRPRFLIINGTTDDVLDTAPDGVQRAADYLRDLMADESGPDRINGTTDGVLDTAPDGVQRAADYLRGLMADESGPDRNRPRFLIINGTTDGVLDTAPDGVQWAADYLRDLMADESGPDRNRPRFLIINGTTDGVLDTAPDGVQRAADYLRDLMADESGPDRNRPRFPIINGTTDGVVRAAEYLRDLMADESGPDRSRHRSFIPINNEGTSDGRVDTSPAFAALAGESFGPLGVDAVATNIENERIGREVHISFNFNPIMNVGNRRLYNTNVEGSRLSNRVSNQQIDPVMPEITGVQNNFNNPRTNQLIDQLIIAITGPTSLVLMVLILENPSSHFPPLFYFVGAANIVGFITTLISMLLRNRMPLPAKHLSRLGTAASSSAVVMAAGFVAPLFNWAFVLLSIITAAAALFGQTSHVD